MCIRDSHGGGVSDRRRGSRRVSRDSRRNRAVRCVGGGPFEKCLQQMWIELTFLGAHLFSGARVRQAIPIRSRARQRIIDVGNAENPRGERDLLASEAVGIPAPIPPFVVVPDDGTNAVSYTHLTLP